VAYLKLLFKHVFLCNLECDRKLIRVAGLRVQNRKGDLLDIRQNLDVLIKLTNSATI
jgi:hypothetical protein